ncbi:MAG: DUF2336 domain-containing protein [Hyphomicrobiaceae bacterium]|nr:DUF2336 domain-containing protein [Hyphomicrobiaceae bacterium]MCC0024897.1 DUF2336 domain-containing protein [Hyphomicrobiaceae bacterium]
MLENTETTARAFTSFRALDSDAGATERDQLFRNMAQLFTFVSDRCDDDQVEQYDEVLCQLAELVEAEARGEVAKLLAPLQRAPGTVVIKLANDEVEVARPLLEFSNVLSDDDLIEIVAGQSEDHRVIIAGRQDVSDRVGHAIVDHGQDASIGRLVENETAQLTNDTLSDLVEKAAESAEITQKLSRRKVDWSALANRVSDAGQKVLGQLQTISRAADPQTMEKASTIAFNRLHARAGFSAHEWSIAWNQIKALSDRRQLDDRALERFAKFAYGHHLGAAITLMLGLKQEVFVKWLATQDYRAMTIACRSMGMAPDMFERTLRILPWRETPEQSAIDTALVRFDRLDPGEAERSFESWRAHAFRKHNITPELTELLAS